VKKKIINFIIDYFFHTAFFFALFFTQSHILLGFTLNSNLVILVFFSTLLIYNFSNLGSGKFKIRRFIIYLSLIICFFIIVNLLTIIIDTIIYITLLLFLVLSYVAPNINFKPRNFFLLKIFLLAFTWALGSILFADNGLMKYILFVSNFLFVVSISIPFDIRDVETDLIITIPKYFGVNKSILLSLILFSISTILLGYVTGKFLLFSLLLFVGNMFLYQAKTYSKNKYYLAGLEALIGLQTVCLWI